jgi:predicted membrane protein (TIGR00267 family)
MRAKFLNLKPSPTAESNCLKDTAETCEEAYPHDDEPSAWSLSTILKPQMQGSVESTLSGRWRKRRTVAKEKKLEAHFFMESVAFGLTDGVICFLGIIVGTARATTDPRLVIVLGIIGGIADALGNAIGFFVSQATERAVQMRGAEQGDNTHVHSKREVWMSGIFSFLATIFTLVLLLAPFTFLSVWPATTVSFIIGTISAFILGMYIGKLGKENQYVCGIKYALITIAGALVAYVLGEVLHSYLPHQDIQT